MFPGRTQSKVKWVKTFGPLKNDPLKATSRGGFLVGYPGYHIPSHESKSPSSKNPGDKNPQIFRNSKSPNPGIKIPGFEKIPNPRE